MELVFDEILRTKSLCFVLHACVHACACLCVCVLEKGLAISPKLVWSFLYNSGWLRIQDCPSSGSHRIIDMKMTKTIQIWHFYTHTHTLRFYFTIKEMFSRQASECSFVYFYLIWSVPKGQDKFIWGNDLCVVLQSGQVNIAAVNWYIPENHSYITGTRNFYGSGVIQRLMNLTVDTL